MRVTALFIALCVMLQWGTARADAPAGALLLSIDPAASVLTYGMVHKLHKFEGTSRRLEGKARLLGGGVVQVGLRALVESFDSGNSNRDAHMKEVTEAARYPMVELKATADGVTVPATFPTTLDKIFKVEVSFHGVKKVMDVPVKITFEAANKAHAVAEFTLSLDAFKIERPSLLFVKVDDGLKIHADLAFKG